MADRGKRRKNQATGLLDGVGKGASSLFHGFAGGISGVVTQPIKESKKSGLGGFFKGVAKGMGGLIGKPVSGVLDTVSKTAEVSFSLLTLLRASKILARIKT